MWVLGRILIWKEWVAKLNSRYRLCNSKVPIGATFIEPIFQSGLVLGILLELNVSTEAMSKVCICPGLSIAIDMTKINFRKKKECLSIVNSENYFVFLLSN